MRLRSLSVLVAGGCGGVRSSKGVEELSLRMGETLDGSKTGYIGRAGAVACDAAEPNEGEDGKLMALALAERRDDDERRWSESTPLLVAPSEAAELEPLSAAGGGVSLGAAR
jgi:hypothetical protein